MIQNGEILDGMYQIIREIGRGGTGIIYLADHLRLRKKVVIKKVKDHFSGQINGRAEVDILKRLHHSYLPQVYDFLVIGTSIYTVMEYVEGQDLQQYLNQGYQFTEKLVRQMLLQLCEVLEYLHTQNPPILHSDIKPSNIMITKQGNVCLIDFNISLDGEVSKDIKGVSPWFAAPEQYEKAMNVVYGRTDSIVLDGRMDIYSLGAVFYNVMTGQLPSPDKEQYQNMSYINTNYSEGICAVIAKAMRKKPSARFQSAGQMKKSLQDTSKMDPLYRRYGYLQAGSVFAWLLCVAAGVLLLYYGSWQNSIEKWQQAYQKLYLCIEQEEEAEIVSQATDMLNSHIYKGYLKRNEDKKAEVLHVLGESYFRQGAFKEAEPYYKEAFESMPGNGEYCKDYAIALVRSGKLSRARQVLESVDGTKSLSRSERLLIQAEMSWMQKDYNSTLAKLGELEAQEDKVQTADTEILLKAYLLKASVYSSQEEYGEAVFILEMAEQLQGSKDVLRQLGQSSVKAASADIREVNQGVYLSKALRCYEELNSRQNPSFEDKLNLALVERAVGDFEKSNTILKEMERIYSDDYSIPMWMCYNYLSLAKKQGNYEGIMDELKSCYKDSKYRYDISAQKDQDMEELKQIMKELGEW